MSDRKETVARIVLGSHEHRRWRDEFLGGLLEVESARGVRGVERALLFALDLKIRGRVLVAGTREGLVALAVGGLFPSAEVHGLVFDAYEYRRARAALRQNLVANVRFLLSGDLPATGDFDWVILPAPRAGESMLSGELLRQAPAALKARGLLLAATDGSNDHWLHDRVLDVFGSATIHFRERHGAAYVARKAPGLKVRARDFTRRFTATLFGREIDVETRPGTFSHGELDEGTLALSEVADLDESSRVLDLGCGCGAVGVAAALVARAGYAVLVDSGVRAVRTAHGNVSRNQAGRNAIVLLAPDLGALRDGSFDRVLTNPPYFSDYRIAESFTRESHRVLVPGGEFLLVTKAHERPTEIVREVFGSCEDTPRRGYHILRARR